MQNTEGTQLVGPGSTKGEGRLTPMAFPGEPLWALCGTMEAWKVSLSQEGFPRLLTNL